MNEPKTFYRIHGSYKTVCLIPIPATDEVKQDKDGLYYYEYKDTDGVVVEREFVYPSKHLAWEQVKADLREEIEDQQRLLAEVILAWSKDETVAKAPL